MERAVNRLLGEIQRCNHSQGQGTSPVVCWDCAIAAMESFASQRVATTNAKVAKLRKQLRYVLEVRGIECLHKHHPGPDDACAKCTSEKLLTDTEAK